MSIWMTVIPARLALRYGFTNWPTLAESTVGAVVAWGLRLMIVVGTSAAGATTAAAGGAVAGGGGGTSTASRQAKPTAPKHVNAARSAATIATTVQRSTPNHLGDEDGGVGGIGIGPVECRSSF